MTLGLAWGPSSSVGNKQRTEVPRNRECGWQQTEGTQGPAGLDVTSSHLVWGDPSHTTKDLQPLALKALAPRGPPHSSCIRRAQPGARQTGPVP